MDTQQWQFLYRYELWMLQLCKKKDFQLETGEWKTYKKSSNNQKNNRNFSNKKSIHFFYHKFSYKVFPQNFTHISSRVLKLPLLLFIDKVFLPATQFSISNTVGKFIIVLLFFTWKINHKVWFHEKHKKKYLCS